MQINLTGKNIQITDPLRTYVEGKFARINRHFDDLIDVHVVLDVAKLEQHAEATIKTRGKAIFADARESDMYAAIDALTDKLDRQVIKHKEKMRDHHAVPAKAIPIE
jgi:putative sigma-54 modulation protein